MAWNRPTENGEAVSRPLQKRSGDRFPVRGAIADAIVVLGAAVAARWLLSDSESPLSTSTSTSTSLIKEVKPTLPAKVSSSEPPSGKESIAKKVAYDTNKWHEVNGYIIPKNARLVNSYLTNKVERTFKYSTDAVILGYLTEPEPGGIMPPPHPIMKGSDKIFLRSLEDPIVISDSDSDEVKERKEKVIVARVQIKERMDAGESFEEILSDDYKLMSENSKIRRDAQKELDKIYKSGDADGAKVYKQAVDITLSKMGIDRLEDPERITPYQMRKLKAKGLLINEQKQ